MTFPQAPALPEELDKLMSRMRLPYMRKAAPDVLATARAQRWDPAEVLRLLIAEEVTGRDAATRRLRRHSANFPTGKTLASWRAEDSTIPERTRFPQRVRQRADGAAPGGGVEGPEITVLAELLMGRYERSIS
ncbi:hypothetical protein [Streptomyces goshikiensis]|uniref:hypothetical protein n=1 Tax=Streptomyces goshikiensis TaxID=1942 RepID=UPI00364D970F